MFNLKTQLRAALTLLPALLLPVSSGFSANTPTIGVATANGKFTLNRANHRNNATLFDGNTFDSGASELEFRLAGGTIVQLGTSARGSIFSDHVTIQDGGGDVHSTSTYSVEALGLQIKSSGQDSVVRVVVSGGQVQVGALRGQLQVWNAKGVLVATIPQGQGDAFTPLTGKIDTTTAAGVAGGAAVGGAAVGGAAVGGAAAAGGVVAAGTAIAGGLGTAAIVAGVAVVSVGAAAGISVAATSGNGDTTLSPSVR